MNNDEKVKKVMIYAITLSNGDIPSACALVCSCSAYSLAAIEEETDFDLIMDDYLKGIYQTRERIKAYAAQGQF